MEYQAHATHHPIDGDVHYRARAQDPLTSIHAAENAALFAGAHKDRIAAALRSLIAATAHQISGATDLTVVQVDRRLPELKRDGIAEVAQLAGEDITHDGFRVWRLTRAAAEKNLPNAQQSVDTATNA